MDDVRKIKLRCPPYEKKKGPGVKKSHARTKILKFCNCLEPWIEFNSSTNESKSSPAERSDEERAEEESSDEDNEENKIIITY